MGTSSLNTQFIKHSETSVFNHLCVDVDESQSFINEEHDNRTLIYHKLTYPNDTGWEMSYLSMENTHIYNQEDHWDERASAKHNLGYNGCLKIQLSSCSRSSAASQKNNLWQEITEVVQSHYILSEIQAKSYLDLTIKCKTAMQRKVKGHRRRNQGYLLNWYRVCFILICCLMGWTMTSQPNTERFT